MTGIWIDIALIGVYMLGLVQGIWLGWWFFRQRPERLRHKEAQNAATRAWRRRRALEREG